MILTTTNSNEHSPTHSNESPMSTYSRSSDVTYKSDDTENGNGSAWSSETEENCCEFTVEDEASEEDSETRSAQTTEVKKVVIVRYTSGDQQGKGTVTLILPRDKKLLAL